MLTDAKAEVECRSALEVRAAMSLEPAKPKSSARVQQSVRFGQDFELDFVAYRLCRSGRVLKLERIPTEVLLLLVERTGELVTREQIVEKIWGSDVFLDTDNSINGAIRKIRQVLKDDPEEPKFVQTITGKGYRFIAPVSEVSLTPEVAAPPPLAGLPKTETDNPSTRRRQVAAALAVLLVACSTILLWSRPWGRPSKPPGRVLLAVLPFANLTGDPAQDYFSDGMTEEMITELGQLDPEHLGVVGRTSVMLYKSNPKSLDQVGRDLGVQYVIEGSVRRDSNRVRITAQLIQVKDQTHVWARQYDRELTHLLSVQGEIAQAIADEIELTLGDQHKVSPPRRPVSAADNPSYEAYDSYLKGRYFWNKRTPEGFRQAASYFQQAIGRDANYSRSYAGLADTFALMSTWGYVPQNEFMPKARAAALKALELDETLAEAHASLALIAENYDYDWQTAEKEFRRAIQLDPGYATAHQWYAEYLSWQGRFDEAISESERARQLDPLSLIIATDHGMVLYYARQYDRAIAQFRAVIEMDPQFYRAHGGVIDAYVQSGRFAEAMDEVEHSQIHYPQWDWALKALIYGRWGRTADAQHALKQVEQLVPQSQPKVPLNPLLVAYVGSGEKDQAIQFLQSAYAEHSNIVTTLKVEPRYDALRSDPRFQDLLRRLGL